MLFKNALTVSFEQQKESIIATSLLLVAKFHKISVWLVILHWKDFIMFGHKDHILEIQCHVVITHM